MKVPQIVKMCQDQSGEGISVASVIFELAAISANVSLFTVKVPQIVKMCQARSGEGISVASVIFELAAIFANVSLC